MGWWGWGRGARPRDEGGEGGPAGPDRRGEVPPQGVVRPLPGARPRPLPRRGARPAEGCQGEAPVTGTVQVDQLQFTPDGARGEDGAVWYLILLPCKDDPCTHVCTTHPGMEHHYERQSFRLGGFTTRPGASAEDIANDRANVWGWDGNRDAPTLSPSFLGQEMAKDGVTRIRPYRLHLFLKGGVIELCGDSTVSLAAGPVPCDWRT